MQEYEGLSLKVIAEERSGIEAGLVFLAAAYVA
jgi:hypothetical protein